MNNYNFTNVKHEKSKVNIENALKHSKDYFNLLRSNNSWTLLGQEDDISVYKAVRFVSNLDDESKKWDVIKSTTFVNITKDELLNLYWDSSKAKLMNPYSVGRKDVVVINNNQKIVWNRTRIPLIWKYFDFSNLMYRYNNKESTVLITGFIEFINYIIS
jgi:hypothetical protein